MSNKTNKSIDSKPIKELTKILEELNLSEISYTDGDFSVKVAKNIILNQPLTVESEVNDDTNEEKKVSDYKNDPRAIKSPMVGTVYLQPEPGANKFVKTGDQVKSGQTLLIIEAMKTMNPIESTLQGKVIKVLVENEQAVEFGQPLMLIG
jgi:acetyl-CoA carboxylase biotin carboxyl carrier protein